MLMPKRRLRGKGMTGVGIGVTDWGDERMNKWPGREALGEKRITAKCYGVYAIAVILLVLPA